MTTISEVVRRLMPDGSERSSGPNQDNNVATWGHCPDWPPDVFAVAATLVNRSGCYARSIFSARYADGYTFNEGYRETVRVLGDEWSKTFEAGAYTEELWQSLVIACGDVDIGDSSGRADTWQRAAMTLLAIADEASYGIGFYTAEDAPIPWLVLSQFLRLAKEAKGAEPNIREVLPYLPGSLCQLVPPQEAVVLPKTMTAQLGCTLRSLSHNLALLPPEGIVATSWLFSDDSTHPENLPLNLLLIPYPYCVDGTCFLAHEEDSPPSNSGMEFHSFSINQNWLAPNGTPLTAAQLVSDLVMPLMERARLEVGEKVHAIVMPEAALTPELARQMAEILAKQPDLELFIAGILDSSNVDGIENRALTFCFDRNRSLTSWEQKKCHRWALDEGQIQRYHLGHILHPKKKIWWEKLNIDKRECIFYVVRRGASLAVMICEDLARFDPSHPVVRSVGPNLLIALLMDGPQLRNRWPGRYATVMADDPGSAVLTLTSIGMVKRSAMPGAREPREIALWKHPGGDIQELQLPAGDHGLLLTLSLHDEEQFTLDGRSDGARTCRFELHGARGIRLKNMDKDVLRRFGLD